MKLVLHEKAVNLARRWSVQNENDLVQEDMSENTMDMPEHDFTHDYCQSLSNHLMHLKNLPVECIKYEDVKNDLKRRDTDTTHPSQVLS